MAIKRQCMQLQNLRQAAQSESLVGMTSKHSLQWDATRCTDLAAEEGRLSGPCMAVQLIMALLLHSHKLPLAMLESL